MAAVSRLGNRVAWAIGSAVLAFGSCVPLAGGAYVLDLGANLAAQGVLIGAAGAIWLALRRCWRPLGMAVIGSSLMAWPLALRPWFAAGAGGDVPLRVMVFNSSTTAGDAGRAMGLIEEVDADVVVLTEPSGALLDLVRASPVLAGRYPGWFLPERAAGGYILVLSRWAQSPVLGGMPKDVAQAGLRTMRIERPEGAFIVVALHPDSPRSPGEWARGNATVLRVVDLLKGELAGTGLPIVAAADLNSTPSGWRSRQLGAAGLRRAKPLLRSGTYPAGWPWPLNIAIDDVWCGRGVEVRGWRRLNGGGSDHVPVLVELSIPGQARAPGGR